MERRRGREMEIGRMEIGRKMEDKGRGEEKERGNRDKGGVREGDKRRAMGGREEEEGEE